MTNPKCPSCNCTAECQSTPRLWPILLDQCIASGQVSAEQIEVHRVLDAAIAQPEQTAPIAQAEPACSDHLDAPHGFDRNASHSAHRYVCNCEGWMPDEESADPLQSMINTSQELGLYDDAHSNIVQPKDKP